MCREMENMRKTERIEIAKRMLASGKLTYEDIATFTDLTLEEIKALAVQKNCITYEEKGDSKLTNRETPFFTRINDLQDYIKKQRTNLESFDETLVKRWLKQITVWEDHFTVKLKSGLKIDIEG